jgi:haloacetate dehalogenase
MFEGFDLRRIALPEVEVRVRLGGEGPPLLLLHGHPQTHFMWGRIAPLLARHFTLVMPDLRGYGESGKPATTADHEPYSKRAMARDAVALMAALGHERFALVGHDRGGRVGYRLALDHPDRLSRLAVLDICPTGEMFGRADMSFGLGYWHWFFLAQPWPFPESVISANPEAFYAFRGQAGIFAGEALADYRRCTANPATIHAMCEDYRAGATYDFALDQADHAAGRRIACPVLALWGARGMLPRWYDTLAVWRDWCVDVRGQAIDAGHYLAEEAPEATAGALLDFLRA